MLAPNREAMGILGKIFTWWDGATIGTAIYSWRKGKAVGTDTEGNKYYQSSDGKRRWVIYNVPMTPAAFRLIGMVGSMAHMMVIRRVTSRRIAVMKLRLFPI